MDALDKINPKKLSRKERQEYAIMKQEEAIKKELTDEKVVKKTSNLFREHIARERKRLGLE